jgi:endonuclease YncB( thermonuclease family)
MPRRSSPPRFRRPRKARPSKGIGLFNWWLIWRVPALALVIMLAWWFIIKPIAQEQGWVEVTHGFAICGEGPREVGCVIDGDTVFISDRSVQRRIRLTGFDAPELDGACETEKRLAIAARTKLHEWLAEGPFEWNGDDNPPRDQYGRELRAARRLAGDGSEEALADVMIASGLAAQRGWGEPPPDWCED